MNKRRSPEERNPDPRPMREGEIDREIIRAVYNYRILSQDQIARLLNLWSSQAQKSLRRLYDHKYLDREFMQVATFGAPRTLYILDKTGKQCLLRMGIEDFSTQPKKGLSDTFLSHTYALNESRIAIEKAAAQATVEILNWLTENELKQDYDRVKVADYKEPISLIPDSYFLLQNERGRTNYFIELDRGTMKQKRFRSKVAAYVQYYKTTSAQNQSLFEKRYGFKSFRVLTIVDGVGQGRVENLLEATSAMNGSGRRFWFAHIDDVTQNDPLFDPIWFVSNTTEKASLLG